MNQDQLLHSILHEAGQLTFAWGTHDCAQFATRALTRLQGVAIPLPPYSSERGAVRVLAQLGGHAQHFTKCGLVRKSKATARVGDIAIVKHHGPGLFDTAFALVAGLTAFCPLTTSGLATITRCDWLEVWGAP